MGKAKTSQEPENFSLRSMPIVEVKGKTDIHIPYEKLKDRNFVFQALVSALSENDLEAFKEILKAHYEALDLDKVLKKSKLSRRTFYSALSEKGNPSLSTLGKLLEGIR